MKAPENARAAVCLPLFALTAGHVATDLPEQLSDGRFDGPLLSPIGEGTEAPNLISEALSATFAPRCAVGAPAALA